LKQGKRQIAIVCDQYWSQQASAEGNQPEDTSIEPYYLVCTWHVLLTFDN